MVQNSRNKIGLTFNKFVIKVKGDFKPMNNPLGVNPSKGDQGTAHEVKKKSFDLTTEVKRFFLYLVWFPDSLY